jgi:Trypsin/Domain of unknown function (DUF4384)
MVSQDLVSQDLVSQNLPGSIIATAPSNSHSVPHEPIQEDAMKDLEFSPAASDRDTATSRSATRARLGAIAAMIMLMPDPSHAQTPQFFELPGAGGQQPAPQPAPAPQFAPAPLPGPAAGIEGGFRGFSTDQVATRVVGGHPVKINDWPSYVLVQYRIDGKVGTCGGTVIAPDWVLTAGHCAVGKTNTPQNFFVIEGTDNVNTKGSEIGVSEVVLHESYSGSPAPHNDVALLHLKAAARSPAQALISGALPSSATSASVAGFGLTTAQPIQGAHSGSLSSQLLQVDIPVVARASCAQILGKHYDAGTIAKVIDDATVCAGDPTGGKDSCNGDSGGPLAITAGTGRVQIGVVSWGPGCAQVDTVGVYASVGNFETWIKQRVPAAKFVSAQPGSTPGPNPPPAPAPSPTPSAIAAIESAAQAIGGGVNLRVDLVEGNRARVGSIIHFHVASPIAGQLLVYNIDLASGTAYQVFPNRYSGGNAPGGTKLQIAAGANVTIPNLSDRFDIKVKEPAGKNRLYAFVLPPNVRIDDLAEKGMDMHDLLDPPEIFRDLANRAVRGVEAIPRAADRGAAVYEYEIVR